MRVEASEVLNQEEKQEVEEVVIEKPKERHRILLMGTGEVVIKEFFIAMDSHFECLTTSNQMDDMRGHIKYFNPQSIVVSLHDENPEDMQRIAFMKRQLMNEFLPLIVIGDEEICEEFKRECPGTADLVLTRPLTSNAIFREVARIMKTFERNRLQKEEEEKKRLMLEEEKKQADRRYHVLIIDDDPFMLRTAKRNLAEHYDVATAISGSIALKFLEKKTTDLILLDYEMPTETGADVLKKLRDNPDTQDIPVIFLTGVDDKEKIKKVLEMKPQGYLLKPIDYDKLLEKLADILK